MDMARVEEVVLSCLRFNPTLPKARRQEIFEGMMGIYSQSRKVTSSSSSLFFPNKTSLFIPLTAVLSSEDEVLIVSLQLEHSMSLTAFLGRV
jgi:hypothetical protein